MPITTLKIDATGTREECDTVIATAPEMFEEKLRRNNCQIVNISMGNVSKNFGGYRQLITVV